MSLYYEAASVLTADSTDSLTSRVYGSKNLKSKPAHVFALVSESTKWSIQLSTVIERASILTLERKLSPALALLLTHDLLLSKHGIAAPKDHVLRLAIERHKARLNAELTKLRLQTGLPNLEAWKVKLATQFMNRKIHRWIRINRLRTDPETPISEILAGYQPAQSLSEIHGKDDNLYLKDGHVPDLYATTVSTELLKGQSYQSGNIIVQDKASCFSAYLLDPRTADGDIIDACAAPGNKTTHLAALLSQSVHLNEKSLPQTIYACERDPNRSITLRKMIDIAGASNTVKILAKQDFTRLDPTDSRFERVRALLLDPSCSGSGMIGRSDDFVTAALTLPRSTLPSGPSSHPKKKKLKVEHATTVDTESMSKLPTVETEVDLEDTPSQAKPLEERLTLLSNFQLTLLKHAMRFPAARKIVYSTCSVHQEENEHVVVRGLLSPIAKQRGWRVLRRDEQIEGLRRWRIRGKSDSVEKVLRGVDETWASAKVQEVEEACIRCENGTEDGTMGFFVVGFVRDVDAFPARQGDETAEVELDGQTDHEDEDSWDGFSD